MKNIKKIVVVVLTFVLSFLLINDVSAATNGSITINGTTKDKVYDIYKIFNLTYSGNETNKKVAYTIDSSWENFFKEGQLGAKYIVSTNSGNLNQITIGSQTKYINITESNVANFAQDALTYLGKTSSITKTDSKKATGNTLKFENLSLGYYLIYPNGATEIKDGYASIASLTSTTPDATEEIKATYPTINKTVKENSYEVGKYAEFTITGKVPDTTGFTEYVYKIHDSWTKGLEYDKDGFNIKVTIGDKDVKVDNNNFTIDNNGFTLTLNVKDYEVGKKITVVYNLKVNSLAINSSNTHNDAYLEYSNNPKTDETNKTNKIEVYVYSSKIEVLKVDGASCTTDNDGQKKCTTPLKGAEFVLMDSTKTKYYKIEEYEYNGDSINVSRIKWVENIEDATVFTTNEDGNIEYAVDSVLIAGKVYKVTSFEGLKDGTYYLLETKAPDGFNKLTDMVKVVLKGNKDTNNKPIPSVEHVVVENNSGNKLPSTGGMGTKLFIVIGSLLASLSASLLVVNKRMSKEEL